MYIYMHVHIYVHVHIHMHVHIYGIQKQPSCKKEAQPSKVESYLKKINASMVWLTTRGDI